ncbi:MAG TPA: hypothetical protein VG077_19225 [Verrucomicrobiae bacterium]|nr:hypothetical protein [Verrucomicrobiae bacterium]
MHLETPTKKLVQTLFLFSACSLAAIVLFVAATTRHHASAPYSANFQVYTYQNPFHQPAGTSSTAVSQTNAGGPLTKLLSVRWFAGLSGLGALWLGASYFLYGGHRKRKRIRHNVEYTMDPPARMNPLAVIPPKPVLLVAEQGKVSFPVLTVRGKTKTRGCFVHRTTTAPCQSRFRPTTLVSSQTRFGRLK